MSDRFTGTVEPFTAVNVAEIIDWITDIDFRCWPQQSLRELKPAMVTDPTWFGFGQVVKPTVDYLLTFFPGRLTRELFLTVVMPGHSIAPHVDHQGPPWICRVHVPLISNPESKFIVGGIDHHLTVGYAYKVNTEVEHAVVNNGKTPRIHFMFDIRK